MPHDLVVREGWRDGLVQPVPPDLVPGTALRTARNVRLDTLHGVVHSRPGAVALSAAGVGALDETPHWLTRFYTATANFGYTHVGTTVYRYLGQQWETPTAIVTDTGDEPMTSASLVDGNGTPRLYLVNPTIKQKDQGTLVTPMGLPVPLDPPTSVTVGTRHRRVINAMGTAAQWTGAGLVAGPTDESNIVIEGSGSVTFTIAPDTLGSIAYGAAIDLSTFPTVIEAATFEGSGLNDLTSGGTYSGTGAAVFEIEITTTGTPDTIRWRKDAGTYTTGVALTGAAQALSDGVTFTAGATTGHTLGARWFIIAHAADPDVALDDYIVFWFRATRPDFLSYIQLDIDLTTTTVANAFRGNYYSWQGSVGFTLNVGRDHWTEVKVRKASFQRFGTNTALDWSDAQAYRLSVLANRRGQVVCYVDDLHMAGGHGLEGDYRYTGHYRRSASGGRGNPPKNAEETVRYTGRRTADRQVLIVDWSNLLQGGSAHPGGTAVDQVALFRDGGAFTPGVRVALEATDPADAPRRFVDTRPESDFPLNAILLESDNDPPPATASVVFGPGNLHRLFLIDAGNLLHYSKAWQKAENRAENWPPTFNIQIGEASETLLNGLVVDTTVTVWTTKQTYAVTGTGADTFFPEPIPESRGLAGKWAITEGDGQLFFLATDGIFAQVGLTQTKLTGALDPFFAGVTVDDEPGIDRNVLGDCRLQWHPAPQGAMVILTYRNTAMAWRELVLKKSPTTGQYTVALFDRRGQAVRALYADIQARKLLGLTETRRVWELEHATATTDAGESFPVVAHLPSDHQGQPRRPKTYTNVTIEAHTGGTATTVTALWNKNTAAEVLGTMQTMTDTATAVFVPGLPTAERQDIALRFEATVTTAWRLYRVGYHVQVLPERLLLVDTDEVTYTTEHLVQRFELDVDLPAQGTLTWWRDGVAQPAHLVFPTVGRQRVTVLVPSGQRFRALRATLQSTVPWQCYSLVAWVRPRGHTVSYQAQPLPVRQAA